MKGFLLIAVLFAALLFVPTAPADAGCLRAVVKVATAPVRLVVRAKPGRAVLRVAVLPVRLAALPVRAVRACR
jgi:hypothetical protein